MAKKEAPLQTFFVCSLRTVAWQLLLSVYAVLQGHPQRQPEQHSVQAAGCRHYGGAAAAAGSSLRSTHVRRGSAGATDKNGFLLLLAFPLFVQSLANHRFSSLRKLNSRINPVSAVGTRSKSTARVGRGVWRCSCSGGSSGCRRRACRRHLLRDAAAAAAAT